MLNLMILQGVASVIALVCAGYAVKVAKRASVVAWRRKTNELESAIADQEITISRLTKALRKVQMQRVTDSRLAKQQNGSGMPDPASEPDAWKKAMRLQIQQQKFGSNNG